MWVVGAGRANNTPRLPRPLQANTSGKEGRGARSVRWSESSAPPRARRDRGVGRKRSGRCRAKEGSFWGFCLAGVERLGRRVTPILPPPSSSSPFPRPPSLPLLLPKRKMKSVSRRSGGRHRLGSRPPRCRPKRFRRLPKASEEREPSKHSKSSMRAA